MEHGMPMGMGALVYGFFLIPIPLILLMWKRSQTRDKLRRAEAEAGALKYRAYLAAQSTDTADQESPTRVQPASPQEARPARS